MSHFRQNQQNITLRDVALKAEVSEKSVSRVMRNAPNVSESLREKVLAVSNELGYTPNRLAGSLKSRTSSLVAVIVPSMADTVFPQVIDGIDSVLSKAGLQPVLGITNYDPEREIQIVRDMLSWAPTGMILTGTDQDPAVEKLLQRQMMPIVQMMDIDGDPLQVAVGISHIDAARKVAEHIVKQGYKNVGYIGGWGEQPQRSKVRRLAFEDHLAKLGNPIKASIIRPEQTSTSIGAVAMQEMIEQHPDIDCVFFANDDLALGAMCHCLKIGIKIPEQIAIIGFNGIDIGQLLPKSLTTIKVSSFEMGETTARTLLALHDGQDVQKINDLGFSFLSRQSG